MAINNTTRGKHRFDPFEGLGETCILGRALVSRWERRDHDDQGPTVAEAAGFDTDETVLERVQRLRRSAYGTPTRTPKPIPRHL